MSEIGKKKQDCSEILSEIKGNMHRDDFVTYMSFCVKKWKRLETELQVIDAIMDSICKQWKIPKDKLIHNGNRERKFSEPRAMMYYVIKKQVHLSYGEIGEIFNISKGYIHKAVDDITFLVEERGQKDVVSIFLSIQKDLSKKNVPAGINEGIKS